MTRDTPFWAQSIHYFMQQGKEWARIAHITCTSLLVGAAFYQSFAGLKIVQEMAQEMIGANRI